MEQKGELVCVAECMGFERGFQAECVNLTKAGGGGSFDVGFFCF